MTSVYLGLTVTMRPVKPKLLQVADHPIATRLARQIGVGAALRRADDGDGLGRDQRREVAPDQ